MAEGHGSAATFERREGTSSQHGVSFQYQTAALLLARALGRDGEARVGAEHAHAGAFDDVSVRVRGCGRADSRHAPPLLLLLQLKHKSERVGGAKVGSQALRGESGSFAVRKYFRSYLNDVNAARLGADPSCIYYVLFTNASLPAGAFVPASAGSMPAEAASLLHTGCGAGQPLQLAPGSDLLEGEPRRHEFLARFLWCGSQASDAELVELLRQELWQQQRRAPRDGLSRARGLVRAVEEWYEATGDVRYLGADWPPWQQALHAADPPLLRRLDFAHAEMHRLTTMVSEVPPGGVLLLSCDTSDEEIRAAKMAQVASQRPLLLARLTGAADASDALVALGMWERGWSRELALVLPSYPKSAAASAGDGDGGEAVAVLAERLLSILDIQAAPARPADERGRALIILAGPPHDGEDERHPLTSLLRTHLSARGVGRWREARDELTLRSLSASAQQAVLRAPALLQGRPCALGELRQEHVLRAALRGDALVQVLRAQQPLAIGEAPGGDARAGSNLYVSRRLLKMVPILPEVFSEESDDVFVVKGITKEALEALVPSGEKVQLLDRNDERTRFIACRKMGWQKFKEFCNQHPAQRCHFLKMVDGRLMWRQSANLSCSNKENIILRFLDADEDEKENNSSFLSECPSFASLEDEVALSSVRTVLVSAEPGAGKSSTLSHVARLLWERHPGDWVLHLSLADHVDLLGAADGRPPSDLTEGLLRRAAGLDPSLDAGLAPALLRDRLRETGRLRVVVDAFDEISPDFTETVLGVLKVLQKSAIASLWVSSRHLLEDRLEAELKVRTFTLKPFDVSSQEQFWVKHWLATLSSPLPEEELRDKAQNLLKYLGGRFRKDFRLNLPLHSTIMANIFGNDFLNGKVEENLRKKDILYIYEKFVDMKFEIYCKEKASIVANNIAMKNLLDALRKDFIEKHQMCALFESGIFDFLDNKLKNDIWKKVETFIKDIQKGFEKTGIILGVFCGKPRFLHRTFAEYFAGKWIAEYSSEHTDILEILFNKDFTFVKIIADQIISKRFPIHHSVVNDDIDCLKEILSKGSIDINTMDSVGRTPLILAIQKNSEIGFAMSKLLLENGAIIYGEKEIQTAVKSRSWKNVKLLLQHSSVVLKYSVIGNNMIQHILENAFKGKLITEEDRSIQQLELDWNIFSKGRSLLHLTVELGEYLILKALLLLRADPWTKDHILNTPLHYAVLKGDEKMVDILLEFGSFVHPKNVKSETPLFLACSLGQVSIVQKFLKFGAALNVRSKTGSTILHAGVDHPKVMEVLLENKLELDAVDSQGNTVLHEATRRKNAKLVSLLVKNKANVNIYNFQSNTPLLIAVSEGCIECAKILLLSGANVTSINSRGESPLHIAIRRRNISMVQLLLDFSADPMLENNKGETPLDICKKSGLKDVESLLSSRCVAKNVNNSQSMPTEKKNVVNEAKSNVIAKSEDKVDFSRVEPLQDKKLFYEDCRPSSKLVAAVFRRNLKGLKEIVDSLPQDSPEWLSRAGDGRETALHVAARTCHVEAVSLLASRAPGAALHVANAAGDLPLHVAAARRNAQLSMALLAAGADPLAKDARGDTALHVACRAAVYPQVRFLTPRLPAGALVARNAAGATPLHLALALGESREERELTADAPATAPASAPPTLRQRYDEHSLVSEWSSPPGRSSARPSSAHKLASTLLSALPGAALRLTDARGDTPLHVAARGRQTHVAQGTWGASLLALLLQRPEVDVAATNQQGDNALHLVCRNLGDFKVLTQLTNSAGAQSALTTKNSRGNTPLHEAAAYCFSLEVVVHLVTCGADPTCTNAQGETALMVAQRSGNNVIAQYLLSLVLPPTVRDPYDWGKLNEALHQVPKDASSPQLHGGGRRAVFSNAVNSQPVFEEPCRRVSAYELGYENNSQKMLYAQSVFHLNTNSHTVPINHITAQVPPPHLVNDYQHQHTNREGMYDNLFFYMDHSEKESITKNSVDQNFSSSRENEPFLQSTKNIDYSSQSLHSSNLAVGEGIYDISGEEYERFMYTRNPVQNTHVTDNVENSLSSPRALPLPPQSWMINSKFNGL